MSIEDQVKQRVGAELSQTVAVETKKAREAVTAEIEIKNKEVAELQQVLAANTQKLAEAHQHQAEVLLQQRLGR